MSEAEEITIRIMCPNLACQCILGVPAKARGKQVRCRKCGTTVRIPPERGTSPSAPPPAGSGTAPGVVSA